MPGLSGQVSPWLAPLMVQYDIVWCPVHLLPYQARWPLGAPSATMFLVYAAADVLGGDPSYQMMCALVEAAPLCCYLDRKDRPALRGIYGKTMPL